MALACGAGIPQALNDFRDDDWVLLDWGSGANGLDFLNAPPPFPYLRPFNALAWQVATGAFGVDRWPIELFVLGLWGVALACLYGIAARAAGPWGGLAAVALAVCTREVRELVNWRSWLTTTGGLAGMLGAVWLAGRSRPGHGPPAPGTSLLALAFGAGFKEVAWWHGAAALAGSRRVGLAAFAVGAFVVHVTVFAPPLPVDSVSLGHVPRNAAALASTLLGWAWPPGLLLLALGAPRAAWSMPMFGAALLACVPALGFYLYSPFYFVEAALLGLLALVPVAAAALRHRPRYGATLAAVLVLCLLRPAQWADFRDNVPWQQRRQREGRALFAEGRGAAEVWAPAGDPGPCGLAAGLLAFEGARRLDAAPADGRRLRECLVIRREAAR